MYAPACPGDDTSVVCLSCVFDTYDAQGVTFSYALIIVCGLEIIIQDDNELMVQDGWGRAHQTWFWSGHPFVWLVNS